MESEITYTGIIEDNITGNSYLINTKEVMSVIEDTISFNSRILYNLYKGSVIDEQDL